MHKVRQETLLCDFIVRYATVTSVMVPQVRCLLGLGANLWNIFGVGKVI